LSVAGDDTVKGNSDGLTDSVHVRNSVHNQIA
jgi:hypothetical protein